jgi:hypothetical protein
MKKFIVSTIIFLFLVIFITDNAQARIYDTETEETITYQQLFAGSPIGGVLSAGNIISYGNNAEIIYDTASGLYDEVLTINSGSWSRTSTFITNEARCGITGNADYVLIQNDTQVDLFFFGNCFALASPNYYSSILIHYHKIKGGSWVRDSNITLTSENFITRDLSCDYSSDEKTIFCNVRNTLFGAGSFVQMIILKINTTKTEFWTTNYYGHAYITVNRYGYQSVGSFSGISNQYNVFGLLYGVVGSYPCGSDGAGSAFASIDTGISTSPASSSNDCTADLVGTGQKITGIPSSKKNYVFILRNDSVAYYGFYSSSNLGVNCNPTNASGAGTFYFCNDTPHHYGYYSASWGMLFNKGVSFTDANGYIHYLYLIPSGSTAIVTQEYQIGDTTWKYHNITSLTIANTQGYGAINMVEGTIFTTVQSNFLYFYYEDQTNPSPIPPSSDNMLGLVCGAGSFLTGTTYEGGCLVASLFILAVALSIIGWILKVMEIEYKTSVPNKYFVSGMVSLALIVAFIVIGLSDIITGFIAFFMIVAILIVYEENVPSKSG